MGWSLKGDVKKEQTTTSTSSLLGRVAPDASQQLDKAKEVSRIAASP